MDPDKPQSSRKFRFRPKPPPPRRTPAIIATPKIDEDLDVTASEDLVDHQMERTYSDDLLDIYNMAESENPPAPELNEDMNSASELGLLPQNKSATPRILMFNPLPLMHRQQLELTNATTTRVAEGTCIGEKGKGIVGSSSENPSKIDDSVEGLKKGLISKMLVYKSGAVKMKLGEVLFDVSPGIDRNYPESVNAINTTDKQCCKVGAVSVSRWAVVTPDIDSLLENEKKD